MLKLIHSFALVIQFFLGRPRGQPPISVPCIIVLDRALCWVMTLMTKPGRSEPLPYCKEGFLESYKRDHSVPDIITGFVVKIGDESTFSVVLVLKRLDLFFIIKRCQILALVE